MSVILPHARSRHISCALGTLLVAASACSGALNGGAQSLGPGAGNDFGAETDLFGQDAGLEDAGALDGSSPDAGTTSLRFVHGIVNLGPLHVCHLPNFVGKGNPAEDERGAYVLPFSASFGEVTDFESVTSLNTGALSLHVEPAPVVEADAGVDDAGVELADAGSELDAGGLDASVGGEFPPDGAEPAPCTRETRITLLSLGANQTKSTSSPSDSAQPPLAARTLVASGVALDPQRLAQRREEIEAQYLEGAPDELAAAETFAQREIEKLIVTYGPTLTLAEEPVAPSESDSFALALTHVVPDVVSSSFGPGGIRLCITTGTLENPVEPPVKEAPFPFRSQTQLAPAFSQNVSYRFRVFPAARFDATDTPALFQDCATTGHEPLAELSVNDETALKAARAYNLVFIGSVAPTSLCAPVDPQAVIQAGCPYGVEQLTPRLVLLPAY